MNKLFLAAGLCTAVFFSSCGDDDINADTDNTAFHESYDENEDLLQENPDAYPTGIESSDPSSDPMAGQAGTRPGTTFICTDSTLING